MKVKALALGTGYAESASWAQLVVYHPKGFDSVQEALEDIRLAVVQTYNTESRTFANSKPVSILDITYIVRSIVLGTLQDYGSFWEALEDRGWQPYAWDQIRKNRTHILDVNNAEELIAQAETLHLNNELRINKSSFLWSPAPKCFRECKKVKVQK